MHSLEKAFKRWKIVLLIFGTLITFYLMARNKNQILLLVSQHTKSPTFFKQDMFYFYENGVSHHFWRGDHFVSEVRLKKEHSNTFWNYISMGRVTFSERGGGQQKKGNSSRTHIGFNEVRHADLWNYSHLISNYFLKNHKL